LFKSWILILKFSKKLDKFYNNLKDWIFKFSNKFDVQFVYVFKVGIIIIKVTFFVSIFFFSIFWDFFVVYISFKCALFFSICFPPKNWEIKKISKINVFIGERGKGGGGGGGSV
jgi:hypothetical protein